MPSDVPSRVENKYDSSRETLHPALLWEPLKDKRVLCRLCPWLCKINLGKRGVCRVRVNEDGRLYSLIYGKVASVAVDPVEKKPLFHFYPGTKIFSLGTFGCNMQCLHCQNWQISHETPLVDDPRLQQLLPEDAVRMALDHDCAGICWTYNEPTIWFEYALDTAKIAKERGLYTAFITNGYIELEALDLIGPFLDAYRVDIKGFKNEFYRDLAKVKDFKPILEATIHAKSRWKMHIECVTNVIPSMNDDEEQLKKIALWIRDELGKETPWHITRFYPNFKLAHLPPTPIETLEMAYQVGRDLGLDYVYLGNVPWHPGENTYCPRCKELVIKRSGYSITEMALSGKKHSTCGTELNFVV